MFYMNRDQMIEACSRMEWLHHEYSEWSMELEGAIRALDGMESAQEMTDVLRAQQSRMEDQHGMLRQMARGLDKIIVRYQDCERGICSYGEQEIMRYPVRDAVAVDLNGLRKMLDSMIYE